MKQVSNVQKTDHRGKNSGRKPWFAAVGLLVPWSVWAAQGAAGIEPALFALGVVGAFAAGVAVGYAVGKSESRGG